MCAVEILLAACCRVSRFSTRDAFVAEQEEAVRYWIQYVGFGWVLPCSDTLFTKRSIYTFVVEELTGIVEVKKLELMIVRQRRKSFSRRETLCFARSRAKSSRGRHEVVEH